jgi:hypothetical protein
LPGFATAIATAGDERLDHTPDPDADASSDSDSAPKKARKKITIQAAPIKKLKREGALILHKI